MGGLARAHRAWGLPEGDLKGLRGEGSLFPGPLTQVEEPISGEAFTAGWKSGGSHSLQEKIKAMSAAAAAVTAIWRCAEQQGGVMVECAFECMHARGEEVKRYWCVGVWGERTLP